MKLCYIRKLIVFLKNILLHNNNDFVFIIVTFNILKIENDKLILFLLRQT